MVVRYPFVSYDLEDTGTNGVLLSVDIESIFSTLSPPQNFTFIIDLSASMGSAVAYMRNILVNWFQTVPCGCGVVFVGFNEDANVVFWTSCLDETNRSVGVSCLQSLHVKGRTNIESGIITALETQLMLNSSYSNRVVLLTDGQANVGEADPNRLASLIARFCCKIEVVMLTEYSSAKLTEAIQTVDNKNSGHFAQNADQLQTVFKQIFQSFSRRPLHVQLMNFGGECTTKVIHEHYQGNTIDLMYEVDWDDNTAVCIFVEYVGGKEQIAQATLSETRCFKDASYLKMMVHGILALQKLAICKSDIIANKEKSDISSATKTLVDINEMLIMLRLNGYPDTPTYRSLSDQVEELFPILKAFDKKDPGKCPVKFKEIEQQQEAGCVYRSLSTCLVKQFASPEDEEVYKKWEQEKAAFDEAKRPSLHALLALKPICV